MRRAFKAVPIALLGGCVARPLMWVAPVGETPYDWLPQQPAYVEVHLPLAEREIARWQLPTSNPWYRYSKNTLLASVSAGAMGRSPLTAPLPRVEGRVLVAHALCAARRIARQGLPPRTLWLVDLPGAPSVAFGATLSQRAADPVALVLTFNNWPAEDETVPARETLSALLAFQPRLPGPDALAATPVFLLDAWRLATVFADPEEDETDNRYRLFPADLPDAETLRQQGITRVVYLVESREHGAREEDDVHDRLLEYQEAGLGLSIAGLDDLCGDGAPAETVEEEEPATLSLAPLVILERPLVIDSLDFYRRAPSAFGGIHAVPTPVHGVMSFRGGFGGG